MADPSEFLTRVLSGPDKLPYAEHQKWTLRQHLTDLLQEIPTLRLSVQTYTQNNGRAVKLLRVEGTLPTYYQGVKYNIPVGLWLPDHYPQQAPLVFVQPTPDMMISPVHAFVNASGAVQSSYIQSWDASRSNLVDMSHDTSIQFGEAPPLFAKPPGWQDEDTPAAMMATRPDPAHASHHSQHSRPNPLEEVFQQNPMISPAKRDPFAASGGRQRGQSGSDVHDTSLWGGIMSEAQQQAAFEQQQAYDRRQQAYDQQRQLDGAAQPADSSSPAADSLQAEFRSAAVACLNRRLQESLQSASRQAGAETNSLLELQTELQRRGGQLRQLVSEMARERHGLESSVLEMNTRGQQVERWLAANEAKAPADDVDPDTAIEPADVLCEQALAAQAEDMAIEDTLYAIERAFQHNAIDATVYLKQVRMLCGKQFFARALGMKIAAAQHRHPPLGGADAAQPYAQHSLTPGSPAGRSVQMQIGDSWTSTGILSNPLQP